MTIESLADDCFRKSGYKINKADLINRITHLCENHKREVNVTLGSVSKSFTEKQMHDAYFKGYEDGASTENGMH